jgi:type IV pilus biogenesis protein CpaD/CtpE
MNKRTAFLIAALSAAGFLAGCTADGKVKEDLGEADFGRAVREDMAAQIADPDAAYKGPPPPSSGERAQIAQQRYSTDTVKQPVSQTTGGGGNVGGGGTSGP